jgi:hypothetical protein
MIQRAIGRRLRPNMIVLQLPEHFLIEYRTQCSAAKSFLEKCRDSDAMIETYISSDRSPIIRARNI